MSTVEFQTFEQSKMGYRHSAEPLLLADFADAESGDHILDIGTGCCIIPILLSLRQPGLRITAIEIQESLVKMAQKNINQSGLIKNITLIHGDFRTERKKMARESFDLIISNPPFGKLNAGRLNPNNEKAIARHELTLNLKSLVKGAEPLLKLGGKIYLAYPPERFEEVKNDLITQGLSPRRYFFAHGGKKRKPQFFIIEALKASVTNCVKMKPKQI